MEQFKRLTNSKILKVNLQSLLPPLSYTWLYYPSSLTAYNSVRTNQAKCLINTTKKTLNPSPSNTSKYSINWQVVYQTNMSDYSAETTIFLVVKFLLKDFYFKSRNDNAVILGFMNKQNDIIHKDKSTPHHSNNKFAIHSQYVSLGKYYA